MNRHRKVNDVRMITGFLMEALFYSRRISVLNNLGETWGLIVSMNDTSWAAKDKSITLKILGHPIENLNRNSQVKFVCGFPQFIAEWTSTVSAFDENQLSFQLPDSVNIFNRRNSQRVAPQANVSLSGPILLQSSGLHSKGILTIEDISQSGIGGLLSCSNGFPIVPGTVMRGKIQSSSGGLNINGKIAQVQIQSQSVDIFGEATYRIGVRLELPIEESVSLKGPVASSRKSHGERRKASRLSQSKEIHVLSPLNERHEIPLTITEISTTGFSARTNDPGDNALLAVGIILTVREFLLGAELVSFSDSIFRFQIVSGNQDDRVKWLKLATELRFPEITTRIANGTELIQLFCQSGALSSEYLKTQIKMARNYTESFTLDASHPAWIHRWIEKSSSGLIKGHISAVRFGDCLWTIGSLAGSPSKDLKISKQFVPSFYLNFRDFCLSLEPCPQIIIPWLENHVYWRDYERYLETSADGYLLGRVFTAYIRFNRLKQEKILEKNAWTFRKIFADEYNLINEITAAVSDKATAHLLRIFDFTKESFSSPFLKMTISKNEHQFKREYFLVSRNKKYYLLILQRFPQGASALKTEDVPWLIPLYGSRLNKEERRQLHNTVWSFAIKSGYDFPGILEVLEIGQRISTEPTKRLVWTIGHPKLLDYFETIV